MENHHHLYRHARRNALPKPEKPVNRQDAGTTLVSYVFVTASPTFSGPIAGYTTLPPGSQPSNAPAAQDPSSQTKNTAATQKGHTTSSTGLPAAITAPSSSAPTAAAVLAATGGVATTNTAAQPSSSAASSSESASTSSAGMATGAKIGIALGVIAVIGAILVLILFWLKKRREANDHDRLEDEKTEFYGGRNTSTRTSASPPRLSLRPVTQFLPNLGERRASRGNALTTFSRSAEPNNNAGTARMAMNRLDQNVNNPFGNHAESVDATNSTGAVRAMGPGGEVLAGTVAAGAVMGLKRGSSKRGDDSRPIDLTRAQGPPSPSATEFSMTSDPSASPTQTDTTSAAAAIAAAGGPPRSTVHRVQLDFKPSMDDELELRAGQLIRLLHEYDDGWALCIRLDRSQQGVVPRTCLSTRPVKPRPQANNPRIAPQSGTRSPTMNQGPLASSPPRSRPITPPSPRYNQGQPIGEDRPTNPPAGQGHRGYNSHPGSASLNQQSDGRGPPREEPASVGRKAVPGQAM